MIDPIAFSIGPFAIHWYGISYAAGLFFVIYALVLLNEQRKTFESNDQIFDLMFWVFLLGVIPGGRLGYVLFYNLPYYLENPGKILAIWEGGMSFHGGLVGVLIVGYYYCKKHKLDWLKVADLVVIPAGIAIMFTRMANFINGELYGREVGNEALKLIVGINFGDGVMRHPSQLYQSIAGFIIFLALILLFMRKKPKKGVLFFSFLALYGLLRTLIEFVRAPDPQIGFIFNYFTLGQIFSFAMLVVGVWGLRKYRD